jgi:hypothetical protein
LHQNKHAKPFSTPGNHLHHSDNPATEAEIKREGFKEFSFTTLAVLWTHNFFCSKPQRVLARIKHQCILSNLFYNGSKGASQSAAENPWDLEEILKTHLP